MVSAEIKQEFFMTFGCVSDNVKFMTLLFEKFSDSFNPDFTRTFKKYVILLNILNKITDIEKKVELGETFYKKNNTKHIEMICTFIARKVRWHDAMDDEVMTTINEGMYLKVANLMKYGYELSKRLD
jgi:hypothetical protein